MRSLSLLSSLLFLHRSLALATAYSDTIFSPYIVEKYDRIGAAYKPVSYPHLTAANGSWIWQEADRWTSGFLPGSFYLLEERKKLCPHDKALSSVDWLTYGRRWSEGLAPLQVGNGQEHDQGFLAIPYLEELKINPTNASAITGVTNFATILAKRYSSIVGCTRSWDSDSPEFHVIIDNMMNLEILFKAADLTGNQTLIEMANSHANRTIANHVRPDGSSYQAVVYDENTGGIMGYYTNQGYAEYSTWTRGQAWGIYGFAKMFNLTTQPHYLDTARRMAKVFLNRLPPDSIPPYDFDSPDPNRPADTSAATIGAEGLFILADAEAYGGNMTGANYYRKYGVKLLIDNFKFALKPTWDSILSNGTSNARRNNTNTGLVYGDYYALQAGNTMLKLGLASC